MVQLTSLRILLTMRRTRDRASRFAIRAAIHRDHAYLKANGIRPTLAEIRDRSKFGQ